MSQLARIFSVYLATGLIAIAGGPSALGQTLGTEPTGDLNSFLQRSDEQTQQIEQLQQENRWFGEGLEKTGEVSATGVAYLTEGGPRQGDQGQSIQAVRAGTLWDEMPSWRPYVEASFRGGSVIDRGEVDLFMPLIWSDTSLLFADLRGSIGDRGHHEGNWALASRHRTDGGWILGAWGSYDLRESETGNHFDQAAFGVEMMSEDLDFRFNGYTPTSLDSQLVPGGEATAAISGGNIVVQSNRELAYWGVDGEFGLLLWSNDPGTDGEKKWYSSIDAELRWFAGGYYFDNPTQGFDRITGPRVRAELRMYDLALLGIGSRLTLEGLIQNDHVRGSQAEAGVYVRIPFGPRPQRRLDRMGRRMVDRIVRDADVIAHHQVINEAASFASNGMAISTASVVNSSDDLSAQVAAAGRTSLVVVDGSEGTISESETTVLSQGQVVLGGGMTLSVIGSDTGVQAEFEAPGERPTVTGTDVTADVFEIADDTSLIGLDISGGNNGVSGENVTGFTLSDLEARGAVKDGFHLIGDVNGTVRGNRAAENGDDGFQFDNFNGGTLSDNTASENGFGFFVGELNGGTVSENTAESNVADGFLLLETNGGTLSDNIANSNGNGFTLTDVNGGNLTGNSASSNDEQGFEVGFFNGGELSGNTGSANGGNGFQVDFLTGGTLSDNTGSANGGSGFQVDSFDAGTLIGNTADSNGIEGFSLMEFNGGVLGDNVANSNGGGPGLPPPPPGGDEPN